MNKLTKQYYYLRGWLFPSHAEKEFRRIMGWQYHRLGFKFQVKVKGYVADFATTKDRRKVIIEIDGLAYHPRPDIVRDQVLYEAGWSVLHIPAYELKNARKVRRDVKRFIRESPRW